MKLPLFFLLIVLCVSAAYSQPQEHLWAGANQYQLWYQPHSRISEQLDAMQDAGLSVLRIFLGERPDYYSWEDPPQAYSFEPTLGHYDDALLNKVDYLMSECKKRGILLIIALENANSNGPYEENFGILGQYTKPEARQAFKNRFRYFLNHHNAYLGKSWKELDTVVLAWEISNEPGIKLDEITNLTREEKTNVLRDWLSDMAAFLKETDPNTYVSLGITGYDRWYNKGIGDDIIDLGNIEAADIYTLHFYGGNLSNWINKVIPSLRRWGKLLIVEEFGVERKVGDAQTISTYQNVAQTCYDHGIPWMFWRLGHRKDGGTWSIMQDDAVWQQVVKPQAEKMNRRLTRDKWSVYEKKAAAIPVWEGFESEKPRYWQHGEAASSSADDAVNSELSDVFVSQGHYSLALSIDPDNSDKDTATVFPTRMAPYDWDLIDSFRLDIYNAFETPITFAVELTTGADEIKTLLSPVQMGQLQPGWNKDVQFELSSVVDKGWISDIVFVVSDYSKNGMVYFDNLRLSAAPVSGVEQSRGNLQNPEIPASFRLQPPQPNPFTSFTTVTVRNGASAAMAHVAIYNLLGQKITEWQQYIGANQTGILRWDGRNSLGLAAQAGVYILRCRMAHSQQSVKLFLLN